MSANERIQWFHKMVLGKCYPNAKDIADKFNISQRQAQRDIEHMRSALCAPLVYNGTNKGYSYSKKFFLPSVVNNQNQSGKKVLISI